MNQRGCFSFVRRRRFSSRSKHRRSAARCPTRCWWDVEISSDSTMIKLSFSHYAVTVRGKLAR